MIEAVIYDMDGLIIDSEPLWREVEIECFDSVGIPLTDELCRQTMGLRTDEVVEYWFSRHGKDMSGVPAMHKLIDESMIPIIRKKGTMMKGVQESLDFFASKGVKLALASSSSMILIDTVLSTLGLDDYFPIRNSAQHEEFGKPHPAVYLATIKKLGVEPSVCLAIEDSLNGVRSAKAAGMKCIAVPEHPEDPRFVIADIVLPSLSHIDEFVWQKLQ